jgi:hypothetical protein
MSDLYLRHLRDLRFLRFQAIHLFDFATFRLFDPWTYIGNAYDRFTRKAVSMTLPGQSS